MRVFKLLSLASIFVAVGCGAVVKASSNASTFNESLANLVADHHNPVVEETPSGVKLLSSGRVQLLLENGFLDVGVDVQGCIGKYVILYSCFSRFLYSLFSELSSVTRLQK